MANGEWRRWKKKNQNSQFESLDFSWLCNNNYYLRAQYGILTMNGHRLRNLFWLADAYDSIHDVTRVAHLNFNDEPLSNNNFLHKFQF